jgi:hypothetical protein
VRTAAAAGNTISGLSQAASAMTIRPTVAASKNAWIPMIVPIVATRAEWATPCVGDATTSAGGAASRPARPRNLCAQPAPLPPCRQGCTDTAALDESTYMGGQSGLVRWRSRPVHMTVAQDVDHLPVGLTLQGAGCRGDALAL